MRYILSYAMDFMKLYVIETGIFGYRVKKGCKPLILALIFTAVYILAFYLSKDNIGLQALAQPSRKAPCTFQSVHRSAIPPPRPAA